MPISSQWPAGPASHESGGFQDRQGARVGPGSKPTGVFGAGPQGVEASRGDRRRDRLHGVKMVHWRRSAAWRHCDTCGPISAVRDPLQWEKDCPLSNRPGTTASHNRCCVARLNPCSPSWAFPPYRLAAPLWGGLFWWLLGVDFCLSASERQRHQSGRRDPARSPPIADPLR